MNRRLGRDPFEELMGLKHREAGGGAAGGRGRPPPEEPGTSYLAYWGLERHPFENVPDPEKFFVSRGHRQALVLLEHAVKTRKAASLLTGEYGTGKTTLLRVLIGRLDQHENDIVLLNYPLIEGEAVFRHIAEQLGADEGSGLRDRTKAELYDLLGTLLLERAHAGRHCVVIVDEAQLLPLGRVGEEVRLLLNFQLHDRNLLSLMLVGQNELWDQLSQMPQLAQRFSIKYRLNPLDRSETLEYIRQRLGRRGIFSNEALDAIYRRSEGIPRRINDICDLALFQGAQQKVEVIGVDLVESLWV